MLLATGNINEAYEVLGVVHAVVSKRAEKKGCSSTGLPVEAAYKEGTNALAAQASASGADGVIHIGYDYRMATARVGCGGGELVSTFELYAWGTAIRLKAPTAAP
jgi:uncharacterized protein YbjQ (UPF0145 family)